jgi:hypothetical protein
MKIYKSNYRNHWISPYTILEKVCFWEKDNDVFYEDGGKYEKLTNFLTPVSKTIQWVWDLIHPQINYVKIDRWDTWSMDSTLADIILPMLKQLKKTNHGAPYVDDEDVPYELKSINDSPYVKEYEIDAPRHFARWEYVMNQMIFAFECKVDNSWEDLFRSGNHDIKHEPSAWDENGKVTTTKMVKGPNDTYVCDYEGMKEYEKRIQNGFRLFGRDYQNLWD